jgi:hypothetical protein
MTNFLTENKHFGPKVSDSEIEAASNGVCKSNEKLKNINLFRKQFAQLVIGFGSFTKAWKSLNAVRKDLKDVVNKPDLTTEQVLEEDVHIAYYKDRNVENYGQGFLVPLLKNFEKDMVDEPSRLNIKKGLIAVAEGKRVAFTANHVSETDPVYFAMYLRSIDWNEVVIDGEENSDIDYNEIAKKMFVIIGSVVTKHGYKEYAADTVNRAYVFQSKHVKPDLDEIFETEFKDFEENTMTKEKLKKIISELMKTKEGDNNTKEENRNIFLQEELGDDYEILKNKILKVEQEQITLLGKINRFNNASLSALKEELPSEDNNKQGIFLKDCIFGNITAYFSYKQPFRVRG